MFNPILSSPRTFASDRRSTRSDDNVADSSSETKPWTLSFSVSIGYEDRAARRKGINGYSFDLESDGTLNVALQTGLFGRKSLYQGTIPAQDSKTILDATIEYVQQNPKWTEKEFADSREIGMSLKGIENPAP